MSKTTMEEKREIIKAVNNEIEAFMIALEKKYPRPAINVGIMIAVARLMANCSSSEDELEKIVLVNIHEIISTTCDFYEKKQKMN